MISPTKLHRHTLVAVLVTTACALLGNAKAQTLNLNQVIQKNIEARGGAEKWAALNTIKMEGTYVSFSNPAPFTIWRQRPDLYRFDTTIQETDIIRAYDGNQAWWVRSRKGSPQAKPVPIPTRRNLDKVTLRERFFEPPFWGFDKKGNQVELLGIEDFDDGENYKLKVTLPDSSIEFWYLDAETFLESGMTGITYDSGRPTDVEIFFSNYRNVDGVLMPFLVASEYGIRYRSIEVREIAINPVIGPAVFAMPDSAAGKTN